MLDIELEFSALRDFGDPLCRIIIDDAAPTYQGPVLDTIKLSIPMTTGEHELRIVHYGKTNADHELDSAGNILRDKHFELRSLVLDGVKLERELWDGAFFPVYNQDYVDSCRQNNIKLPYSIKPNLYFGYNGTWKFTFFYPVYPWLIKQRQSAPDLKNTIFTSSDELLKQAKEYFLSAPDIVWKT